MASDIAVSGFSLGALRVSISPCPRTEGSPSTAPLVCLLLFGPSSLGPACISLPHSPHPYAAAVGTSHFLVQRPSGGRRAQPPAGVTVAFLQHLGLV